MDSSSCLNFSDYMRNVSCALLVHKISVPFGLFTICIHWSYGDVVFIFKPVISAMYRVWP